MTSTTPVSTYRTLLTHFNDVTLEEWRRAAEITAERDLVARAADGLETRPLYTTVDRPEGGGYPGLSPYLRGRSASGYVGRPWAVLQEIWGGTPAEANRLLLHELGEGLTGVRAICAVQHSGEVDADLPGIRIRSPKDLDTLFDGVELRGLPVVFEAREGTALLQSYLYDFATRRGYVPADLDVTFVLDPLAMWQSSGALDDLLLSQTVQLVHGAVGRPDRVVGIDGRVYAEAGAGPVAQIAFLLGAAVDTVRRLEEAGVAPDVACARLTLHLAVGTRVMHEAAKFRALRLLWHRFASAAKLMSAPPPIFATSLRFGRAALDPPVNILRGTAEAIGAVLGGVEGMTIAPFDEPCGGGSTPFSRRLARTTQLILLEEAGFARVVDPGGGSYLLERVTVDLARDAWELFRAVERRGGMRSAIQEGFVRSTIDSQRVAQQEALASRREVMVGVSMYGDPSADPHLGEGLSCHPVEGSERLVPVRLSTPYERLHQLAERYRAERGSLPVVSVVLFGSVGTALPRAEFAREFLAPGGFLVQPPVTYPDAVSAAAAIEATRPEVVVVCAGDDLFGDVVPEFVALVRDRTTAIVAGRPGSHVERFVSAGVAMCIHLGGPHLSVLEELHSRIGGMLQGSARAPH
jgi:methylmalonyl-CoA mutase